MTKCAQIISKLQKICEHAKSSFFLTKNILTSQRQSKGAKKVLYKQFEQNKLRN